MLWHWRSTAQEKNQGLEENNIWNFSKVKPAQETTCMVIRTDVSLASFIGPSKIRTRFMSVRLLHSIIRSSGSPLPQLSGWGVTVSRHLTRPNFPKDRRLHRIGFFRSDCLKSVTLGSSLFVARFSLKHKQDLVLVSKAGLFYGSYSSNNSIH